MRLCQEALERGVFAQAIRPPSVADGSSRLRLTAMASHTTTELEMAAGVLGAAARAAGIEPQSLQPELDEREEAVEAHDDVVGELAYDDASSYSQAGDAGLASAPFDVERELGGFDTPAPAPARVGAAAPFDLERERPGRRRAA
jgi:glycine C-acetyltransferase/8-amino-7-oxononanoate synthase